MRKRRLALYALIGIALVAVLSWLFSLLPLERWLDFTGPWAMAGFLAASITEVILAPVPGGIIGFLAAANLGFWKGWMVLYAGNVIGATVAFWLARRFGRPFVERMVSEKHEQRYTGIVERYPVLYWFVYSVPIFPIDVISILSGFSTVRKRRFFPTILTALPFYTGITAGIGSYFDQYIPYLNVLSAVAFAVLAVVVVYVLWRVADNTRGNR